MSDRMSGSYDKNVKFDRASGEVTAALREGIPASVWPVVRVLDDRDMTDLRSRLSDSMVKDLESYRKR